MPEKSQWRKPRTELVERFHEAAAGIDGLEFRKMFGYPAGFVGGNLATSMLEMSFIVRLPEDERQERLADGWAQFEPMPGRTMREYVVLPEAIAVDPAQAHRWMERAAAYVRTLPPKEKKKAKRR